MNSGRVFVSALRYPRAGARARDALRHRRIERLLAHARVHSPYFARALAGLGPEARLEDVPPTNKVEMMAHFDEWVTDREVTLGGVQEFTADLDNIGRRFCGRYGVYSTSGSTGNPSIVLWDRTMGDAMAAINVFRAIARRSDFSALMRRGFRTAGVYATGGFFLGYSSARARTLASARRRRTLTTISVLDPLSRIVDQLNLFQPAMLASYPSQLELLAFEQEAGRLHIDPVLIMAAGEHLDDSVRDRLARVFGCTVQTSYSCTEAGTIACECAHGRLHVNDDWIVVEPVDADNEPVPDGSVAEKILVTNLANLVQPFIRFEITDRVIRHREPCPCGARSPWLELEGRSDDIVTFDGADGPVRIAPLTLYAVLTRVKSIRRFQVLSHPGNRLELRLDCADSERTRAFESARALLLGLLADSGVSTVEITLSPDEPRPHPVSGKFQHITRTG